MNPVAAGYTKSMHTITLEGRSHLHLKASLRLRMTLLRSCMLVIGSRGVLANDSRA